jgi:hypothetical protein
LAVDLRQPAQHIKLGLHHVHMPVEENVDFRRTPPCGRTDAHRSRDVLHGLFDGTRDGRHHFVGRHDAVVHQDDNTREIGLRENRRRHVQRREDSRQAQGRRDERDGQRMPDGKAAEGCALPHFN